MSLTIRIPANMRNLANGEPEVTVDGSTVQEALDGLISKHPDLRARLLDESGDLQSFVNVFVDNRSIRELEGLKTSIAADSELLIVPALAGG